MGVLRGLAKKAYEWISADEGTVGNVPGISWMPGSVPVREADATASSAVMACVFWAMRNVGQAKAIVEKRTEDGWSEVVGHPLTDLLRMPQKRVRESERTRMNGRRMLGAMTCSRMLDGNAYLLKLRNRDGVVIGLDWLPHRSVEPVVSAGRSNLVESYRLNTGGKTVIVPACDIVHDADGIEAGNPVKGMSRLKCLMRQISTDNQIAAYSQALLKNPVPSLMVCAKDASVRLTQADADALAKQLYAGAAAEQAGGVIVPSFPAELTRIGFRPDDLAIVDLNRIPEQRIAAVFGIPAIVVGLGAGLERSTFANFKEAREAATEEFLKPLWQDLAATFTEQLLPEFGGEDGAYRVAFDLSEVGTLQDDRLLELEAVLARARSGVDAKVVKAESSFTTGGV